MAKILSNSVLDRKNILNNPFAVEHLYKEVGIRGVKFENEYRYTLNQVSSFFEVDYRTIQRYVRRYANELRENGYEVLTGIRLQKFQKLVDNDINVVIKRRRLGVLNFKAFLNIGMLLSESGKAKVLRSLILDIVIDVVSKKTGGSTKYINQRDEDYLFILYMGENYRKEFKEALKKYVDMGNFKYILYTDKVYTSIFKEKAAEYKTILNLSQKKKVRDTLYSEILTTISMYETGLANELKKKYEEYKRKLTPEETDLLFNEFEKNPVLYPQVEIARKKMASRDYGFRDTVHPKLMNYIGPLDQVEFERFLGEKSKELAEKIEEYQDVFKRLKDK